MPNHQGKRIKGKPVDWDELKNRRNITLTETAWRKLLDKGESLAVSRSEVIERTVRGILVWESDGANSEK